MSRYMDLDVVVPMVKNIAKYEPDATKQVFFQGVAEFLDRCPSTYMDKLVICADCWYCDHEKMRCIHNKGLSGKLQPNYHCPFGAPTNDGSNEDPPEIDFSMFDFAEDDDEANS